MSRSRARHPRRGAEAPEKTTDVSAARGSINEAPPSGLPTPRFGLLPLPSRSPRPRAKVVEFLARGLPPRTGLRRDLWISTADASAYSVMVGCGEHYIPAFALALGFGPVATGLTASAPLFVGAVLQLVTPLAV